MRTDQNLSTAKRRLQRAVEWQRDKDIGKSPTPPGLCPVTSASLLHVCRRKAQEGDVTQLQAGGSGVDSPQLHPEGTTPALQGPLGVQWRKGKLSCRLEPAEDEVTLSSQDHYSPSPQGLFRELSGAHGPTLPPTSSLDSRLCQQPPSGGKCRPGVIGLRGSAHSCVPLLHGSRPRSLEGT